MERLTESYSKAISLSNALLASLTFFCLLGMIASNSTSGFKGVLAAQPLFGAANSRDFFLWFPPGVFLYALWGWILFGRRLELRSLFLDAIRKREASGGEPLTPDEQILLRNDLTLANHPASANVLVWFRRCFLVAVFLAPMAMYLTIVIHIMFLKKNIEVKPGDPSVLDAMQNAWPWQSLALAILLAFGGGLLLADFIACRRAHTKYLTPLVPKT